MLVRDLIGAGSRLYAKSEWAPASAEWPALSFSRRAVANAFSGIYTRGSDFVISIGTSNPKDTLDPAHRQRLLSIVDVEPKVIVSTADLVDPEAERIKDYSKVVSPQGAERLTAESLGVLIHVLNQVLRTNAAMLKLQGEQLALQNKKEKLSSQQYPLQHRCCQSYRPPHWSSLKL